MGQPQFSYSTCTEPGGCKKSECDCRADIRHFTCVHATAELTERVDLLTRMRDVEVVESGHGYDIMRADAIRVYRDVLAELVAVGKERLATGVEPPSRAHDLAGEICFVEFFEQYFAHALETGTDIEVGRYD
jgi:hypothetical protein